MNSRLQSLSAEEFNKRLDAYKKTAKVRHDSEVASFIGKSPPTVRGYRKNGIGHKEILNFCEMLNIPDHVFTGGIDEYHEYLERKFTARWRNIINCDAYRADVTHAIIHETAAGRLVQPISNKDGTEYTRIKIGSSNRLKIDLLALLRDQEVVKAVDGEVAFEGFEPANGSAPLQDFFVYVLQIERTGCLLLRPNSHFSLSDDPKDNEDILEIEDLDNPCQGMNGMLYVPAPSRNRSNYMVFSGEPGVSRIIVLMARWPAIYQTLRDALSDPNGADPRLLDDLAENLMPYANKMDPKDGHYWRIYEQTYELVR